MAEEKELTDEELAAQWAAAASGEGDETLDRLLNQDEIDSLLGGEASRKNNDGTINFLINNSKISHERLPMLEVVFDRLVHSLSTTLRNFTSCNVEVNMQEMTSVRFGDYVEGIPLPAMINVFQAIEWQSNALLTLSTNLIYSTIDVLLGSRQKHSGMKVEGRPFTSIERSLLTDMTKIILQDLTHVFHNVTPVKFESLRMEVDPRFVTIVRQSDAVILVRMNISIEDSGGILEFCIPYASIEPVREQITQMFMGEKSGQDNMWSSHLADEVWDADVSLEAILGREVFKLGDVLEWQKGTQIELRTKPTSTIEVCVDGLRIASGKMGKKDKYISVKLEDNHLRQNIKAS